MYLSLHQFISFLFSNYRVPVLLSNEISSHMIEKILHVVTPELWQEIYESYFNSHVPQLAQHPIANFIVQHLMASATDKSQVGNLTLFFLLPLAIYASEYQHRKPLKLNSQAFERKRELDPNYALYK